MDISINEQNQDHIQRKIESGKYGSPDDVVGKALELLDEYDEELERESADVRAKVHQGTEQADVGELTPGSDVFDGLMRGNAERTTKSE